MAMIINKKRIKLTKKTQLRLKGNLPMMRHLRIKKGNNARATQNVSDNESEDNSEEKNINNNEGIEEEDECEEYEVNGEKVDDIEDETDKKA